MCKSTKTSAFTGVVGCPDGLGVISSSTEMNPSPCQPVSASLCGHPLQHGAQESLLCHLPTPVILDRNKTSGGIPVPLLKGLTIEEEVLPIHHCCSQRDLRMGFPNPSDIPISCGIVVAPSVSTYGQEDNAGLILASAHVTPPGSSCQIPSGSMHGPTVICTAGQKQSASQCSSHGCGATPCQLELAATPLLNSSFPRRTDCQGDCNSDIPTRAKHSLDPASTTGKASCRSVRLPSSQRIYVCGKQNRAWTLHEIRKTKRLKLDPPCELLKELRRLETEISVSKHSCIC
jgi:hypothetical protein